MNNQNIAVNEKVVAKTAYEAAEISNRQSQMKSFSLYLDNMFANIEKDELLIALSEKILGEGYTESHYPYFYKRAMQNKETASSPKKRTN